MRRLLVAAAVAAVLVIPVPVGAEEDLSQVFEAALSADYHGSGVVMCSWGADSAATTYDVTRVGGMSMVHNPGGAFMTSGGMTASQTGTDWYALEVAEWAAWSMSDRYTMSDPEPTERLGRPAASVTVFEDGRPRARLILDLASTVPLLTEVLDASGRPFRVAAMVAFDEEPVMGDDVPHDFAEHDMMMPVSPSDHLPDTVFGYRRTDTYGLQDAGTQAFYSDGLFSFSIFEAGRGSAPADFAEATLFEVGGATYRRIVTPSHVWVQWDSPDRSFVMVGDLPPDHIEAVLAALPEPGVRGVISRWLSTLFG